jgi:hypothetical protein
MALANLVYGAIFEWGRGSCLTESFVTKDDQKRLPRLPKYMEGLVRQEEKSGHFSVGFKEQPTNNLPSPYKGYHSFTKKVCLMQPLAGSSSSTNACRRPMAPTSST